MRTVDVIVTKWILQGDRQLRSTLQSLAGDVDRYESRASKLNTTANALVGGGTALAGALGLVGNAALKSSGNMQMTQAAFEQMLGSAEAGQAKIAELQQFAAKTPFSMNELVDSSKKLLAMGFTADELIPTLGTLGNAMAALGANDEMFGRVVYNLGQIRAQGKATAVDLRQFAMAGINVAEVMELATGKKFSLTDMTEMDGERFIEDFSIGLNKKFGGMMDKLTETLPGKLNNMGDALEKLKIAGGELISDDAIAGVAAFTDKLERLEKWIKNNPDLAKGLVRSLGIGAAGAISAGLIMKATIFYRQFTDAIGKTASAKQLLQKATVADDMAEKAKTTTALKESAAIGGVGTEAAATTQKLSVLARTRAFLAKPLGGGLRTVGGLNQNTYAVSRGGAAAGAALGAAAGFGVNDDMQSLGYSAAESAAAGAFTGVGAAATAMFLPGGQVAVAMGTGIRYLFNEVYNRPLEREAEEGSGLDADTMESYASMSADDKSAAYFKQAEEKRSRAARMREGTGFAIGQSLGLENITGTDQWRAKQLDMEAQLAMTEGNAARRRGRNQEKQAVAAGEDAWRKQIYTRSSRRKDMDALKRAADVDPRVTGATEQRNGNRKVTVEFPQSRGDRMQRDNHHAAMTPQPAYG